MLEQTWFGKTPDGPIHLGKGVGIAIDDSDCILFRTLQTIGEYS